MDENRITLDIETSARVGLFFGNTYKANIAKVVQEMYVFGFSWKPLGKKVQSCYIWDFKLYKKDPRNDIEVVKKYIEVINSLNGGVVIGQNSRSFDDKVMFGRIIMHNLAPPTPFQTVDTMRETKAVARYDNNSLDWVSKQYGHGGKLDTGGIDLWWDCMCGIPKAMKKMVRYCERDVIKTEKKYLHERRYYKTHPNLSNIAGRPEACPKCASEKGMLSQGTINTKTGVFNRWQCKACWSYSRSRKGEKNIKPRYV